MFGHNRFRSLRLYETYADLRLLVRGLCSHLKPGVLSWIISCDTYPVLMPPDRSGKTALCKCIKRCGGPNSVGKQIGYTAHKTHMREEAENLSANFHPHLQNIPRALLQLSTSSRLDKVPGLSRIGEDTRSDTASGREVPQSGGLGLRGRWEDDSDLDGMDIDQNPQHNQDRDFDDRQLVSNENFKAVLATNIFAL